MSHVYQLQVGAMDIFKPDKVNVGEYMKVNWSAVVPPTPFGLKMFKGSKTFRLPRQFVFFLLEHEVAQTFIGWSRTQISPEEQIIPSLARISSTVPAPPLPPLQRRDGQGWSVRQDYSPLPPCGSHHPGERRLQLALWSHSREVKQGKARCRGTWRNNVCVFSLR